MDEISLMISELLGFPKPLLGFKPDSIRELGAIILHQKPRSEIAEESAKLLEDPNNTSQESGKSTSCLVLFAGLLEVLHGIKHILPDALQIVFAFDGNGNSSNYIIDMMLLLGVNIIGCLLTDMVDFRPRGQLMPVPTKQGLCHIELFTVEHFAGSNCLIICEALPSYHYDTRLIAKFISHCVKNKIPGVLLIIGEVSAASGGKFTYGFVMRHPYLRLIAHKLCYQRKVFLGFGYREVIVLTVRTDMEIDHALLSGEDMSSLLHTPVSPLIDLQPKSELPHSVESYDVDALLVHTFGAPAVTALRQQAVHPICSKAIACARCYTTSTPLLQCGKCHTIWYCSRECQVGDWKRHKKTCMPIVQKKDS